MRHETWMRWHKSSKSEPFIIILISVENLKSTRRFSAAFPPFFSADARIGLQKTTKNPLKNQLRIFKVFALNEYIFRKGAFKIPIVGSKIGCSALDLHVVHFVAALKSAIVTPIVDQL